MHRSWEAVFCGRVCQMKRLTLTVQLATVAMACVGTTVHAQSMGGNSSSSLQLNTSVNSFSNTANRTTSSSTIGLPGSFGGPGITGVARVEYSNTNVFNSFSSDGSAASTNGLGSGGGMSGMGGAGGMGGVGGLGGMSGLGGMGGLGGGRLGMMGGLGGLGGFRNQSGLGGARNNSSQMRVVVRPDMENLATERQANIDTVPQVLSRLPLPERLQGINANVDADTIVLTGQVASDSDKRLAEKIVRLEPGVYSVRNELEVVPTARPLRSNSTRR